jgi:hypothetical protein
MKKILFFLLFPLILFANVGKITAVNGEAYVIRAQDQLVAALGMILEKDDEVQSKADGKVQLTFNDKTLITLGNNSQLSISEYLYDESTQKPKAEFKLSKGVFRTITGKIGKIAADRFKVKTNNATIGIRGTEWDSEIVEESDGTTTETHACNDGEIVVTSNITGVSVVVSEDQATTVEAGKDPETPKPKSQATMSTVDNQKKQKQPAQQQPKEEEKKKEQPSKQKEDTKEKSNTQEKKQSEQKSTKSESTPAKKPNQTQTKTTNTGSSQGEKKSQESSSQQSSAQSSSQSEGDREQSQEEQQNSEGEPQEEQAGDTNTPAGEPESEDVATDDPEPQSPVQAGDEEAVASDIAANQTPPSDEATQEDVALQTPEDGVEVPLEKQTSDVIEDVGEKTQEELTTRNLQELGQNELASLELPNQTDQIEEEIEALSDEIVLLDTVAEELPQILEEIEDNKVEQIIEEITEDITQQVDEVITVVEDVEQEEATQQITDEIEQVVADETPQDVETPVDDIVDNTPTDTETPVDDVVDDVVDNTPTDTETPVDDIVDNTPTDDQVVDDVVDDIADNTNTGTTPTGGGDTTTVATEDPTVEPDKDVVDDTGNIVVDNTLTQEKTYDDGLLSFGYWLDSSSNPTKTWQQGELTSTDTLVDLLSSTDASASYKGGVVAVEFSQKVSGTFTMDVDFSSQSFSQNINVGDWALQTSSGAVNANGFSGSLGGTVDGSTITTGETKGNFYGSAVDAVGGEFSASGASREIAGSFGGAKQ